MPDVQFLPFDLPAIEVPVAVPEFPDELFGPRYRRLEEARIEAGLDCVLVYADREHFANLAWLTGFAPRFEEALWLQGVGDPVLLAGNESLSLARSELRLRAALHLYQGFSLPDQDRTVSNDLVHLLREAGLRPGMRCGLIGWKPMEGIELPFWIVQAVQELTGEEPVNANALLMDPGSGLRISLEPEAVPYFEYASSLSSAGVLALVRGLREGQTEREAAAALQHYGLELSCHPMVNFGRPIATGLPSPRNAPVVRGQYAQAALGVVGGLTSRAGRLITSKDADEDDYLALVTDYLLAVRSWYRELDVGAEAAKVVAATEAAKSGAWELALNPGHILGLDEWVGSPFWKESPHVLAAGTALQQDLIPVPRDSVAVINMEDGLLLADAPLRHQLRQAYPDLMERCDRRRDLMERLGYEISLDVLPLSNMPGVFMPFLLEPTIAASFA